MAVIPKEVIAAVMESASIVDVVSRYSTKVVKKGERLCFSIGSTIRAAIRVSNHGTTPAECATPLR